MEVQLRIFVGLILTLMLAIASPASAGSDKADVRLDVHRIQWAPGKIIGGGELKITNGLVIIPKPSLAPDGRVTGWLNWGGFTCFVVNSPQSGTASMLVTLIVLGMPPTRAGQRKLLEQDSFKVDSAPPTKCSRQKCPIIVKGKLIFSREDLTSHLEPKSQTLFLNEDDFKITYEK